MAVTSETRRTTATGNGATTAFPTGFLFLANSEVKVRLTASGGSEVLQTEGVHYTLTGAGSGASGTVTMLTAPPLAAALVLERTVPFVQPIALRTQGDFAPEVHEDRLDELTFQTQQLNDRLKAVEVAGAPVGLVAGNGLTLSGSTMHVGAGAGVQVNADDVAVIYGDETMISGVNAGAATTGAVNQAARIDHRHQVSTASPVALVPGGANVDGTSVGLARADHIHALAVAAPADVTKAAASAGGAASVSRSDHKHDVTTAIAVDLTDATNAEGNAVSLARSNHTHSHGARSGGTLHALATSAVAGFMSGADKTKLDGLATELITENTRATKDGMPMGLLSWTPTNNTAEVVDLFIIGRKQGASDAGGYHRQFTVTRFDGVTSLVSTVDPIGSDKETNPAWDIAVAISGGTDVQVTVTGAVLSTVDWSGRARRLVAP